MGKKIPFVGLLLVSGVACADYRVQVSVDHADLSGTTKFSYDEPGYPYSDKSDHDSRGDNLAMLFYFNEVPEKEGPLEWSAFLAKASSIGLVLSRSKSTSAEGNSGYYEESESEFDSNELTLHFVIPQSNAFLDVGTGQFKMFGNDAGLMAVGLGTYLTPTSAINIHYYKADVDHFDKDWHFWSLGYTAVFALQRGQSVSLEPHYSRYDQFGLSFNDASAKVTWYLNNQLGLIADVGRQSGDDGYIFNTYKVGANYFVNPSFALGVYYLSSSYEIEPYDFAIEKQNADGFKIELTGRF